VSQSQNNVEESIRDQYLEANERLSHLLQQGRSFSGNERNCCFLNTRDGRFANISAIAGIDFPDDGRALAMVDWDGDGDLDIWTSNRNAPRLRLLVNQSPSAGKSLTFKLRAISSQTPRDAIGARVEVFCDSETQPLIRTLRAGVGFLSQSTKTLHFGLGTAQVITSVVVRWPGGEAEAFSGATPGGRYLLVQGVGEAESLSQRQPTPELPAAKQQVAETSSMNRIALQNRVPMPVGSTYRDFQGVAQVIDSGGRPVLVNLWASWCAPCLKELADLTERREDLRNAGLRIYALSVDELAADSRVTDPAATIAKIGFPFKAGRAGETWPKMMQGIHNSFVVWRHPLPVPSSFLFDRHGQLAVIYKGRVSVDQLISDVVALDDHGRLDPLLRSALLPGAIVADPVADVSRNRWNLESRLNLARKLQESGRFGDALAHLKVLLHVATVHFPEWGQMDEAHFDAGNSFKDLGQLNEAIASYQSAIELNREYVEAYVNLGSVLVRMQRYSEALEPFRKATEIRPDFELAQQNLRQLEAFLHEATP